MFTETLSREKLPLSDKDYRKRSRFGDPRAANKPSEEDISCGEVIKIRDIKKGVNFSGRTKKRSDRREPVTAFKGDGGGRESEMAGRECSLEQEIGGMLPSLTGSRR